MERLKHKGNPRLSLELAGLLLTIFDGAMIVICVDAVSLPK